MTLEEFKKDWRNMGQLDYLSNKKLKLCNYSECAGDHEHCEFCSEKISKRPGDLNEGYCSVNTKYEYWICPSCFEELKDIFKWRI